MVLILTLSILSVLWGKGNTSQGSVLLAESVGTKRQVGSPSREAVALGANNGTTEQVGLEGMLKIVYFHSCLGAALWIHPENTWCAAWGIGMGMLFIRAWTFRDEAKFKYSPGVVGAELKEAW